MKKLLIWILSKVLPNHLGFLDESPFQSLTPTDNAEDIETYSKAMTFALSPKRKDIRNIAVTGQYGSGKSSFLRTYFKNRNDVLWVSLALFLDQSVKDENSDDFEHKLELSILQQMFHVRKESTFWCWKIIIILVLLGLGIVGIRQPDVLVQYVSPSIHTFVTKHAAVIFWLSWLEVSGVSIWALRSLIFWLKSLGVKKIEVNGAGVAELGIEMPDKAPFSILNHNVTTIINFFAKPDYSTVIFEDIDRFNDLRIFTKLREINLLLNNSKQIPGKKKPIRFIYALREELFKDEKNKVKFFDFVIPIIPRVNASNSRTELLSYLHEWGEDTNDESLNRFVKEVAPYISDMRLLRNIWNEFYTYRGQIVTCTSEHELLGLVVFKNFFPNDFALMHNESGMIWELLMAKKAAQDKQTEEIDNSIRECLEAINNIKNEKLSDVKQLQFLYYATLMREFHPNDEQVLFRGRWTNATAIIHDDDWFEALRKNEIRQNHYGNNNLKWSEIEAKTDPACSYEEHVRRIEGRQNGRIDEIQHKIQDLRNQRLTVKHKTIQQLMAEGTLPEETITAIVQKSSKDRQDVELVLLLLKNGYLNEKYYYNISIFHEVDGVNSFEDYLFELGVMKGKEMDWDTNIKNPRALIDTLDLHYFSTQAIKNYSLCGELLQHPESEKAKEFWRLIAQKDRNNYEFVDGCLKHETIKNKGCEFFGRIMSANQNYMRELIETSGAEEGWPRSFVERQLGLYVAWALRQKGGIVLDNAVKEYIEGTEAMPRLLQENDIHSAESMNSFVRTFGLKFKTLDCDEAKTTGFLDVVIAECSFAIDGEMIMNLLKASGAEIGEFQTKNYSVIRGCGIPSVAEYVDAEFSSYLDNVYLRLESIQEDSEAIVLHVLNRDELSDDDKQRFIKKQSNKGRISDAKSIKSETALALCVKLDWVVPSWSNAVEIWNRNKDDKSLFWLFANRPSTHTVLAEKNSRGMEWAKDEFWAKRFAEANQLTDEAMNSLLAGMSKGVIENYSGANATPKRIEYLVRGNRIKYSVALYRSLRNLGNDSHITLAAMFIKDFCETMESGLSDADDVQKLLASEYLHRRNMPLLVNTLKGIITSRDDLAGQVAGMVNPGNYNQLDEEVLDAIVEHVTPESLQCKIIQHIGGSSEEIRDRLKRLSEPYRKLGEFGCHPQISKWDGLESFVEFLKEKGIVSSASEKEKGKIQMNTTQS